MVLATAFGTTMIRSAVAGNEVTAAAHQPPDLFCSCRARPDLYCCGD
ncbi:MAG: hypothetical protein MZV64_62350 [Ignavibacteriales bacterium]|nr:hypothetical protein [Ignavibacteriales bacterium]